MSARTWTLPLLTLALSATSAAAWNGCPPSYGGSTPAGYSSFKIGGYGLDSPGAPGDLDGGIFLGTEVGVSPNPWVDIGFTMDWYRRQHEDGDVILIDAPYEIPIEGRIQGSGSSTNLIPLGGVVRLRIPVGDGRIAPFVSAGVSWDILRLHRRDVDLSSGGATIYETTDYFHGPGGTVALGLEASPAPGVAFVLEVGAHGSEPSKELNVNGLPVQAHANADGEFARIGLRLGFR
jgi:hypothetical protein